MIEYEQKLDLLAELESASAYLGEDIQALSYISENLMLNKKNGYIDIPFVINNLELLLRAMLYNKEQLEKTVNKIYRERSEKYK